MLTKLVDRKFKKYNIVNKVKSEFSVRILVLLYIVSMFNSNNNKNILISWFGSDCLGWENLKPNYLIINFGLVSIGFGFVGSVWLGSVFLSTFSKMLRMERIKSKIWDAYIFTESPNEQF